MRIYRILLTVGLAMSATASFSQDLPNTISAEAADGIRAVIAIRATIPRKETPPRTQADWDARHQMAEQWSVKSSQKVLDQLHPVVTALTLGGVPVIRVTPAKPRRSRQILIYVHGGGYTLFSAQSTLAGAASMADAAGLPVYSIDYTVAPRAKWQTMTDQVISVYKTLLAQNHAPRSIGMFGDSAGGSLVAGSVLKLRDEGIPMPGALVLQSPWSDITGAGDSYETLKTYDAILVESNLKSNADVYADASDQKNPYVSPVYGDYSKGFPPTLIQGGTREIFLSNFVRHYSAIRNGGAVAELDLYEAMPHVFQTVLYGTPESKTAFHRSTLFWQKYLRN